MERGREGVRERIIVQKYLVVSEIPASHSAYSLKQIIQTIIRGSNRVKRKRIFVVKSIVVMSGISDKDKLLDFWLESAEKDFQTMLDPNCALKSSQITGSKKLKNVSNGSSRCYKFS